MRNYFVAAGSALSAFAGSAMAAVDTAAVQTGINSAVGSAESVGALVVGGVASLVVIGLIIGIVRKL